MRRLRTIAVAACTGLVATVLVATPASAGPATSAAADPAADVSSGQVPVFDAKQNRSALLGPAAADSVIRDYWTADRLKSAVPAPAPKAGVSTPRAESTAPAKNLSAPVPAKAGGLNQVAFTHAEGKVFFRDPVDGRNYTCSAGTVNSTKKRLVMTAGHCVHGGSGGQWMENWVFYPGYQFGAGPAGAFPAWQLWTKNAWINDSNFSYDYAIAITQTNSAGAKVVNRVGGNGLTVNPGRPFVTAIAYPGNFQNGEQQAFCQDTLSRRSIFNADQQLDCDMRFGASGGPWLRDYSDSSTLGYIVSNQSYSLNSDGSGPEYGPYYDDATTSLYNSAESASP